MAYTWKRLTNWLRVQRVAIGDIDELTSAVPYFSSGTGAPTSSAPDGSVYLRRDGGNLTTLYTRVSGAWVAVDAGVNFGSGGISADVIAESTAAAGVTVDGLLVKDGSVQPGFITDPGNAGAISVTKSGVCAITTAGVETRTLAIPSFIGQWMTLICDVDGGSCAVTVAAAINQTGNTVIALADAADMIHLVSGRVGGALRWRVAANDGCALS